MSGIVIPSALPDDLDAIKQLGEDLATIPSSSDLESKAEVDGVTEDLKALKKLKKDTADKKKAVVGPLDEARKIAEAAFNDAKAKKKEASEPYDTVRKEVERLDRSGRDAIAAFTEEERRKQEEELQAMKQALENSEEHLSSAMDAANADDMEQAQKLKDKSDEYLEEYHDREQALADPTEISGVGVAHYLDFTVTDITQVPDSFIDLLPDIERITTDIEAGYPGVKVIKLEIDEVNLDPILKSRQVNRKKVLDHLKADKGNVIPGIQKEIKDRAIVKL